MTERFVLTIPAVSGFHSVASLVLGGIGSRLDLPYERVDDLQLAVLSALESASEDTVTVEVEAGHDALSALVGPLAEGAGADPALAKVLDRLVDEAVETRRDGQAWLTLRLARSSAS